MQRMVCSPFPKLPGRLILNQTEPALHKKKEKGKAKQWVGLVKKAEKDMPKFGNTCMDIK